jgi:hypothetical protein
MKCYILDGMVEHNLLVVLIMRVILSLDFHKHDIMFSTLERST